jgi:hypothetical protein
MNSPRTNTLREVERLIFGEISRVSFSASASLTPILVSALPSFNAS